MMLRSRLSLFLVVFIFSVLINVAEAARFGGSKSSGIKRQGIQRTIPGNTNNRGSQPNNSQSNINNSPQSPFRSGWTGPLMGLAAGLGLAGLFSAFGLGPGGSSIIMILIIGVGLFILFRLLFRMLPHPGGSDVNRNYADRRHTDMNNHDYSIVRRSSHSSNNINGKLPTLDEVSDNSNYNSSYSDNILKSNIRDLPESFDLKDFERLAKVNFIRLQAANDTKDLSDIREYVSPQMYGEIKMLISERGDVEQITEVINIDAKLVEHLIENDIYHCSIHFSGQLSEKIGDDQPIISSFNEIWHLTKPVDGSRSWVISGIEQINDDDDKNSHFDDI